MNLTGVLMQTILADFRSRLCSGWGWQSGGWSWPGQGTGHRGTCSTSLHTPLLCAGCILLRESSTFLLQRQLCSDTSPSLAPLTPLHNCPQSQ